MPANDDEHLSVQFEYMHHGDMDDELGPRHEVWAVHEGADIGVMRWTSREIKELEVDPEHQRKGVATGMWKEAHRVAAENPKVPKPKHSADRTTVGDAWARSVGGRLPRLKRIVDDS